MSQRGDGMDPGQKVDHPRIVTHESSCVPDVSQDGMGSKSQSQSSGFKGTYYKLTTHNAGLELESQSVDKDLCERLFL